MKPTETIDQPSPPADLDDNQVEAKYAALLHRTTKLDRITHHDLLAIAEAIERGHTLQSACDLHGIDAHAVNKAAYGCSDAERTYKAPTRPRWALVLARAKASCLDFWLERLRTADGKGLGIVKAAEFMLSAIDRPRFAPTDDRGGAVNVQVMIGPGAGPTTVKAEVIGSTQDGTKLIQDGTHPGSAADAPTPLVVQHLDCGPDVPDA